MKKSKWILVLSIVAILVVGMSFTVFAASKYKNPAEIIASLTGKTVAEVRQERRNGNSFVEQAIEADVLSEFQEERLVLMEEKLDRAVENGRLTEEEAKNILKNIKERQENCDGTCVGPVSGDRPQLGAGPIPGDRPCDGTGEGLRDGTGDGPRDGTGQGPRDGTGKGMRPGSGQGPEGCIDGSYKPAA